VFSIVITEKGGAQRQLDFQGSEIDIGRLDDNDICLPKSNVSKLHARLVFKDNRFLLLDQRSTNGTYVNGRRISAPMVVRRGDKIYIGDFILTLVTPDTGVMDPLDKPLRASYAPPPPRSSSMPLPPSAARPRASGTRSYAPPPLRDDEAGPSHTVVATRPQAEPPEEDMPAPGSLRPPPAPREALPPLHTIPAEPPAANSTPAPMPPPSAPPPPASVLLARPEPIAGPATLAAPPASMPPAERLPRQGQKSIPPWASSHGADGQHGLTSPAVLAPSVRLQGALSMLMERLSAQLDVRKPTEGPFPSEYQPVLERLIDELADEGAIGPDLDRRFLRETAISEAVGLGPLDRLLANRAVREVVIDGPARILADLGGGLSAVSAFFSGPEAVLVVARRLLQRAGRELDPHAAVQEATLPGGGLVQLLLPPLSPKGPLITLRCPPRGQTSPESMITDGMLSSAMLAALRLAVQERKNILVLGPQGAGVSTLLSVLSTLAPDHDRVVVIEDSPSLSLLQPQALTLCRRAAPALELGALLKYASRLRYDRLVIDDLRAQDALPALTTAAATSGVLLGMHAPDPSAALTQLELFAQLAIGGGGAVATGARASLAGLLASAIQLLVHIAPGKDDSRRIQSISEVRGAQADRLEVRMLYRHEGGSFRAVEHK
jgi:pilus assembly protein CpaF